MKRCWLTHTLLISIAVLATAPLARAEEPMCTSCTLAWEAASLGPNTESGAVSIDDDNPVGSGLTISARTGGDTLSTVAAFTEGLDALDGFVNGIESNATCPPGEICFGSSNADTDEEFLPVLDALAAVAQDIDTFRTATLTFSTNMWTKYGQFGGINPVAYRWKDSAGNHSVETKVSDFRLAQTRKKKKGNFLVGKVCMKLEDYTDDGTNTWVTVTQTDPSTPLGLWQWNPFGGVITKKACASYSVDRVGLAKCP